MKWLNLVALTLQFVAFWFAAPELMGAATLKRVESRLHKFLTLLPMILLMTFIFLFAGGFSLFGILSGLKASEEGVSREQVILFYGVLAFAFSAYAVFLVFFKKIRSRLERSWSIPLTERLINNNQTRFLALQIGAVLFTLGYLMQVLVAVFQ